jgi:hypothetical protein
MPASPSSPLRRWWDRSRARREGSRDGSLGVPVLDEIAIPPALAAIAQRADESIASLHRRWVEHDERLGRDVEVREGRARASEAGAQDVLGEVERARRRVDDVPTRDAFASSAPQPVSRIRRGTYAIAIVAVLIAEFPLNAVAFRLFGEAEVLTWIMTASLAAGLVVCAHGLGVFLRQPHHERRWIWILTVGPVLVLIGVAIIRERYLAVAAEAAGLELLGPMVGSVVFLAINLLVYAGATLLSYLAHAPAPAKVVDPLAIRSRELAEARGGQRQAETTARVESEAAVAAAHAHEEARRVAAAQAREIRSYYRQLMAVYRTANLRARRSPEIPAVLRDDPPIAIPRELDDASSSVPSVQASAGNGLAPADDLAALTGDAR